MTRTRKTPTDLPTFEWDHLVPRDERNRYRIYRARNAKLELVATTGSEAGVGVAICTLQAEGEFKGHDCSVGVLDSHASMTKRGTWIVNPFASGGTCDE